MIPLSTFLPIHRARVFFEHEVGLVFFVERTNGHSTGFFSGVRTASKWDDANFDDTSPRIDMNRKRYNPNVDYDL